ncbi:adenosylcobinamide-GDP ribazoletransferase [Persicobacter diffluens]|uniref:Adenosylcobinamide-GDP ribazoletransferase n=1 Tax=Persicobacter diffluens TaxID=981 RepID=A0AAN4VZT0_9BACT|nr:adenosylcobinamide-GDP ribazoletransferase [Persicobacter diffluens]
MKKEIKVLLSALMFYTRIPSPVSFEYDPDYINQASKYFPLMGWIVGVICFGFFWLGMQFWDVHLATILSMVAGVLATGAFHEDGLADAFDGFGGGWSRAQILEIMKDSRVGTYGAAALIFLFLLKFWGLEGMAALTQNNTVLLALLFINFHSLARLTAITIVFTEDYAREDATSKVKPIAKKADVSIILVAFLLGLLPLALLSLQHPAFLLLFLPLILLHLLARRYFRRKLGGYTGDCLGAVEQLAELLILLSYPLIWKFIS